MHLHLQHDLEFLAGAATAVQVTDPSAAYLIPSVLQDAIFSLK
jgi:hypothetical protein